MITYFLIIREEEEEVESTVSQEKVKMFLSKNICVMIVMKMEIKTHFIPFFLFCLIFIFISTLYE